MQIIINKNRIFIKQGNANTFHTLERKNKKTIATLMAIVFYGKFFHLFLTNKP